MFLTRFSQKWRLRCFLSVFLHEEIKHVWLCGTWSAILPSIPCVSTFTDDLAQSVFSICLWEWFGGKKNNCTSRVSDCNFSAEVNRSWQKNLFTNKTVLHYLTKFNTTLLFFYPSSFTDYTEDWLQKRDTAAWMIVRRREALPGSSAWHCSWCPLCLLHLNRADRRSCG